MVLATNGLADCEDRPSFGSHGGHRLAGQRWGPAFNQQGEWIGVLVGAFNGAARNERPDRSIVTPLS
jgi:hypothetical protein